MNFVSSSVRYVQEKPYAQDAFPRIYYGVTEYKQTKWNRTWHKSINCICIAMDRWDVFFSIMIIML
jgi:hypothetical protein